jgi:hypothetical protein
VLVFKASEMAQLCRALVVVSYGKGSAALVALCKVRFVSKWYFKQVGVSGNAFACFSVKEQVASSPVSLRHHLYLTHKFRTER